MTLFTSILFLTGFFMLVNLKRKPKQTKKRQKYIFAITLLILGYCLAEVNDTSNLQNPSKKITQKSVTSSFISTNTSSQSSSSSFFNSDSSLNSSQVAQTTNATPDLAALTYSGQNVITINNNDPGFSLADLDATNGPWQKYGNLDSLNRVTEANALLNQSLMPKSPRERLYISPTGWHNKRISSGWLYNRSHLIGFQLTGQNNNPKNLMTGTRLLNDPGMVAYENEVASYLKLNPNNYVRYSVRPIFYGNDLLARGVQLRAQALNSSAISFNVYIFNVQPGVTLNYSDGTSQVG